MKQEVVSVNLSAKAYPFGKENQKTLDIIKHFLVWAEKENFSSYDWWDIWGTKVGQLAKKTYFRNKLVGSFLVAPITLLDLSYPGHRKFIVKKRQFPICHAHLGLGFLTLFETTNDQSYLEKAKSIVKPLLKMASTNATGLAWGMKHQWMTIQGLIPPDIPCNTQTAYPYSFFSKLYEITGEQVYFNYLKDIAKHVANDFPEWRDGDKLSCSYSTIDKRKVINANSYRMFMLLDAGKRFNDYSYSEKGIATLRYILSKQKEDGSWPYSEDQNFVDHYHTVFVLKNLIRSKEIIGEKLPELENAIKKGMDYYLKNLFDSKGYPKPFSIQPRLTIFKYDCYDLAEAIGFFADQDIDQKKLLNLIEFAGSGFQTKDGWFKFRIYKKINLKGIPYIRYANSAMFYGLTKALKSINN